MNKFVLAQATLTIPMNSDYAHTSERPVDMDSLARAAQTIIQNENTLARAYLEPTFIAGTMVSSLYAQDAVTISATYIPAASCSYAIWSEGFKNLVRGLLTELNGPEVAAVFFNGEGVLISR